MGLRTDWQKAKKDFKKKTGKDFKLKGDLGPNLDKAEKAYEAVEKARSQNDRDKLAAIKLKAAPHVKTARVLSANYFKTIRMASDAADKEAQKNKKDKDKQAYAKAVSNLEAESMSIVQSLISWSKKCA